MSSLYMVIRSFYASTVFQEGDFLKSIVFLGGKLDKPARGLGFPVKAVNNKPRRCQEQVV